VASRPADRLRSESETALTTAARPAASRRRDTGPWFRLALPRPRLARRNRRQRRLWRSPAMVVFHSTTYAVPCCRFRRFSVPILSRVGLPFETVSRYAFPRAFAWGALMTLSRGCSRTIPGSHPASPNPLLEPRQNSTTRTPAERVAPAGGCVADNAGGSLRKPGLSVPERACLLEPSRGECFACPGRGPTLRRLVDEVA